MSVFRTGQLAHNLQLYQTAGGRLGNSLLKTHELPAGAVGKPCTLYYYAADVDAAFERAVDAGATPVFEPTDMYYGDRSGVRHRRVGQRLVDRHAGGRAFARRNPGPRDGVRAGKRARLTSLSSAAGRCWCSTTGARREYA